jgi:hypothetical protein
MEQSQVEPPVTENRIVTVVLPEIYSNISKLNKLVEDNTAKKNQALQCTKINREAQATNRRGQ